MSFFRKRGCLFYFLLGLALFLALYFFVWAPTYSWKQKLTVTLETPQGEVSGSSVVKAWFTSQPFDFGATRSWRGEANVVDLGDSRYLFATLGTPVGLVMAVFGEKADYCKGKWTCIYRSFKGWFYDAPLQTLSRKHYPLMVTFDDINDPASVKRVDPDDLDAAFGLCPDGSGLKDEDAPWRAEKITSLRWAQWKKSGLSRKDFDRKYSSYLSPNERRFLNSVKPRDTAKDCHRIKSITLEITREPVTEGKVEEVLGWLDWSREKFLEAGGGENPICLPNDSPKGCNSLGRTSFRKE